MFACIEFKFLLILQELQQATKLLKHCPPMKYLWETKQFTPLPLPSIQS